MLTNKESEQVDVYIRELLSPKEDEYEEIDDFIVTCSCDEQLIKAFISLAYFYERKLTETINSEFVKYKGATFSLLAAQERLFQLKILLNKMNGKDSVHEISMLCVASSTDLHFWEQNRKSLADNCSTL